VIFDSLTYLVFLAVVVAVYWQLSTRNQNYFLVLASYVFYAAWDWRFLFLILASTLFDYAMGHWIARTSASRPKRQLLIISISINLLVLIAFKYFDFFAGSLAALLNVFGWNVSPTLLNWVLPIGLSFYTFEAIAYIVSVYRGVIPPARSFVSYALFIAFFPHLIAGPIMQPKTFLPQMERARHWTKRSLISGLDLIIWGLVKKVFIADNVGHYVDQVFRLENPSLLLTAVATLGFGMQILADFSAYTDIARGSARLLGFELMKNFYRPYLSGSIVEFWRRWHVSLSRWIRDYLYIPMGGSRTDGARRLFTILFTWLLCGLWHGAAWTFALWGLYYGLLIAWERFTGWSGTLHRGVYPIVRTFLLVHLGWLLFRTPSLKDFADYFSWTSLFLSPADASVALVLISLFVFFSSPWIIHAFWRRWRMRHPMHAAHRLETRLTWYGLSALVLFFFGHMHSNAFIYFQF